MSKPLILSRHSVTYDVSPRGATVTRFQLGSTHVLYPQQVVYVDGIPRMRGGIQICAPWFGPRLHLPQHGIIRTLNFSRVVEHSDTHVQLITDCPDPALYYPFPFSATVSIYTGPGTLFHKLGIRNTSNAPMPLAPGIHPYYPMPKGKALIQMGSEYIQVGGSSYEWGNPSMFEVSRTVFITIPGLGKVTVPKGTSKYCVVWTDHPDYVAVSLVAENPLQYGTPGGFFLQPGHDFTFENAIQFDKEN